MGPPRERATASTPRRSIDPDHGDRDPKRRRGGEERAKESPPKLDRLEKKEKAKREKERKEKEGKEKELKQEVGVTIWTRKPAGSWKSNCLPTHHNDIMFVNKLCFPITK